MKAKWTIILGLILSFSSTSVFASVDPAELMQRFVDADYALTQVINVEMNPSNKNPSFDKIENALRYVEEAYDMLKDAGHDMKTVRRNGAIVAWVGGITGGALLLNGLYYAWTDMVDSQTGDLLSTFFKMEKSLPRAKYGAIAGLGLAAAGTTYYFYARSKSKKLQRVVDKEVKETQKMFTNTCLTRNALETYHTKKGHPNLMNERFPVITRACKNAILDVSGLN